MSESFSEAALVDGAVAGDMAALEQLLSVHFTALERHVAPKISADVRRQLGAEDILQEVFAHAFRDIAKFEHREGANFLAWLKTIADHRLDDAIKHIRRKKRGGDRHQLSKGDMAKSSTMATLIDLVCHDSHLPEKSAIRREAERAMQIALAGLPDDQRDALYAHYLQGQGVEQIAEQMGRTTGAVRGLIDRGKKKLAEAMGRSSQWLSSR